MKAPDRDRVRPLPALAIARVLLLKTTLKLLKRQVWIKLTKFSRTASGYRDHYHRVGKMYRFIRNMSEDNVALIRKCRQCFEGLAAQSVQSVGVYGSDEVAEILYDLTFEQPIQIEAVYDDIPGRRFRGRPVQPIERCCPGSGQIVIASLGNVEEKVALLVKLGVTRERIWTLG